MQDFAWQLSSAGTLAFAALVLMAGRLIVAKIRVLQEYSIPAPVVGGLIPAIVAACLRPAGMAFTFDTSLQPGLLLAFFATVGLSADLRLLARGGRALLLFFGCVVAVICLMSLRLWELAALVNMEAVSKRYGWSAQAFLLVPIVGAFMIDIANAIVLSGIVQVLARWR